ncbi:hypothetical protein A5658_03480 [Mycobacterium sp. 1245111.1]|uniref:hypothetical protein n=1 Tax=Mycobacterium sp. 1245111.1 TaxID=1834073 RepID=UPI0008013786|nr:hypothetical protein [Mycobacterium sp. 1245111.1]OBK38595.1 hypothetical protein A5658_03480 [Mycobacterium sp. 1245111.1]
MATPVATQQGSPPPLDDALRVVVLEDEMRSCWASIRGDASASHPLLVKATNGECYVSMLLAGPVTQIVLDGKKCWAAGGFLDEVGSTTNHSPSGFAISDRCTFAAPIDNPGPATGYLFFSALI